MLTFKEYLETSAIVEGTAGISPTDNIAYRWAGNIVKMTKHGIDRVIERSRITKDQLALLFQRAIEKMKELRPKLESEVLFYSRSLEQGFVSAIDKEGLRVITFLPRGKQFAKAGTKKMVVEGFDGEMFEVAEFIEIE